MISNHHNQSLWTMKTLWKMPILMLVFIINTGLAEGSNLKISIRSHSVVSSDRVNLGHIALISGGTEEEVQRVKSIYLTNLPMRAKTKTISRGVVIAVLKRNRITVKGIDFTAPETIKISRETMMVKAKEIQEMARNHLEDVLSVMAGEINVTDVSYQGKDLALPVGELRVEFLPFNNLNLNGPLFVYANLLVDGKLAEKVKIKARVEMYQEVAMATRTIKKGEILTEEDFALERRLVKRANPNLISNLDQLVGKRAKRSIAANTPLQQNMLDLPPIVHKKNRVKIILQSKFLKITAVGVATENGAMGNYIKVMNLDSKKIILAKVVGDNLVKVDF